MSSSAAQQKQKSCERRRTTMLSMCRACLVLLNEQELKYDLVEEEGLAIKFLDCTSISVALDSEDEMPKSICGSCYQLLRQFHEFQCMCAESMLNFQKLLDEAKVKEVNENSEEDDDDDEDEKEVNEETEEGFYAEHHAEWNKPEPAIGDIDEVYIVTTVVNENTTKETEHKQPFQEVEQVQRTDLRSAMRNKLICHICTQRFYKSTLLEAHLLKHKGEQVYKCVLCNKTYSRQYTLRDHIREKHSSETNTTSYTCKYQNCPKVYKSERSLNYHIRTKHKTNGKTITIDTKNYTCEKCGNRFSTLQFLKRHKFVHATKQARPFACNICEQRFYTKQNLYVHIKRHDAIRPTAVPKKKLKQLWHCLDCDKTFTEISNYRMHKRLVHEGIRKYACSFCGKNFSKREHLIHHEMRHTGERPHKCEICDKGFIQKSTVKLHMKRIHQKENNIDGDVDSTLIKKKPKRKKTASLVMLTEE